MGGGEGGVGGGEGGVPLPPNHTAHVLPAAPPGVIRSAAAVTALRVLLH